MRSEQGPYYKAPGMRTGQESTTRPRASVLNEVLVAGPQACRNYRAARACALKKPELFCGNQCKNDGNF